MSDSPDTLPPEQPQPDAVPSTPEFPARPVTGVDLSESEQSFDYKALLREVVETALMAAAIWLAINLLIPPFEVDGPSMQPNVVAGERLLVNRPSYFLGDPARGDVVVFRSPEIDKETLIKRIIGLPGETIAIRENRVFVNGQPLEEPYLPNGVVTWGDSEWTVPEGTYLVLGDNRLSSRDSRSWGPLNQDNLLGKALVIYWPPSAWGAAPHARQFSQDYLFAAMPPVEASPQEPAAEVETIPTVESVTATPASSPTPAPAVTATATLATVEFVTGLVKTNTYILATPDFAGHQLQQLYALESTIIVTGRDGAANWIFVHLPGNSSEGWVWRDSVDIPEDAVQQLPVLE